VALAETAEHCPAPAAPHANKPALLDRNMNSKNLIKRYRIDKPRHFRLSDHDPADTDDLEMDKEKAKGILAQDIVRLEHLQELLYAQSHWAVLAIFQAMDAAGKDSAIKHVMSGINPQGCEVHAFKQPTPEELDHDFLWRAATRLPARGRIGIFNRSYYEEMLVVRVHPELLAKERLPPQLLKRHLWRKRFDDVNAFEQHLTKNGMVILKFFLNVSKEEQKRRFLERLETPAKRWKFSSSDITERALWPRYMQAYDDMIRSTSTPNAPWYVVPADHKSFRRLVVAAALVEALERLDLRFPKVGRAQLEEMQRIRTALESEA
jgi:PPK2 family polyphosphate:nucleotide phosphotransferase